MIEARTRSMSMPAHFPEPFATLASADGVMLGPVGVAATRTAAFEAYERAKTLAAQHEELLAEMLELATPAGRLYAALLLARYHPQRARAAWELLAQQEEAVSYAPGGCSIFNTTLAAYARGVLHDGMPGLFPAAPTPRVERISPAPRRPATAAVLFAKHSWWLIGLFWLVVLILLRRRG